MTELTVPISEAVVEAIAHRAAELVAEQMQREASPWMDRKTAATYLGLPVSRLEKDRRIPCHRDGGRVLYHRDELDAHFGAIRLSGNWTYFGDTVRVRFRNARARAGDGEQYRVCYTHGRRLVCRNRTILGHSWDAWRLRITPSIAGRVHRRYLEFTWRVDRRIVARKRIRIFYDV